MNADILTNLDIDKLIAADKVLSEGVENYIATLAVTSRVSNRNLLFTTEGNLIGWRNNSSREEKWAGLSTTENHEAVLNTLAKAFSGIQILHASFYSSLAMTGKFSLIDAYLQAAAKGTIGYYDHSDSILLDVGKPENIEKAESLFK
jgi:NDP-sugar pyrophosphorylase family protein